MLLQTSSSYDQNCFETSHLGRNFGISASLIYIAKDTSKRICYIYVVQMAAYNFDDSKEDLSIR